MIPDLIILPLTYLGPIQYYSKFFLEGCFVVEQYDHYDKQSFRNRSMILGANGPVVLTVPIKRKHGVKTQVRDILVDYDTDWRRLHWKGIISAYNSSPYFEYYKDSLRPFYKKEFKFLADLNMQLTHYIKELLKIEKKVILSKEYLFPGNTEIKFDFREVIHPKCNFTEDETYLSSPYKQVFSDKFGFISNLSIIDLIFNMGPEARHVLNLCIKKEIKNQ